MGRRLVQEIVVRICSAILRTGLQELERLSPVQRRLDLNMLHGRRIENTFGSWRYAVGYFLVPQSDGRSAISYRELLRSE